MAPGKAAQWYPGIYRQMCSWRRIVPHSPKFAKPRKHITSHNEQSQSIMLRHKGRRQTRRRLTMLLLSETGTHPGF